MASKLDLIYDALAAWTFTIGTTAINTFWDTTLKQQITTADLPARLLLPVNTNLEGDQIQAATITGGVAVAYWAITDMMLYKPTTQGTGLEEAAPFLVDYVKAYMNKFKTGRRLISGSATITQVATSTGIIEWPVNSNRFYHGANITLQVTEVF